MEEAGELCQSAHPLARTVFPMTHLPARAPSEYRSVDYGHSMQLSSLGNGRHAVKDISAAGALSVGPFGVTVATELVEG